MSISNGLSNVTDVVTPLEVLKERLQRSEIVKRQKMELSEIYTACLAATDFEYVDDNSGTPIRYKLVSDLLMIDKDFYKILIPDSMIGLLLSHTHLLGHKGLNRMLADLKSYWFKNMTTVTKKFVAGCYSCFLSHKGSRKQKVGIYPTPSRPFQEVTMDLAENLNTSGGYSHLLVLQCTLTDFVILVPLKSKTSTEISRALLNSVLMQYNVEKIHSDNGPGFRAGKWLEAMAALGIKVIASAALHPAGRGQVERLVGTVKLLMKKMLATRPTLDWEYIPFLVAKILNNTTSPKTGFKPAAMVYGTDGAGSMFLDTERTSPPHYFVKSQTSHIEQTSAEIKAMTDAASDRLTQLRLITNERVNQTRTNKNFKPGDFVFLLDRSQTPGNARVLRTKLNPSPYVVVRPLWTTTLVKRLADGFVGLYSNSDLKKYEGGNPLFNTLPVEVTKVLLHSFSDLLAADFTKLTKLDPFEIPETIPLFEPNESNITRDEGENSDIAPLLTLSQLDVDDTVLNNKTKPSPVNADTNVNLMPDDEDLVLQDTLQAFDTEQIQADVEALQKDTADIESNQSNDDSSDSDLDEHELPPVKYNDVVDTIKDDMVSTPQNKVPDISSTAEPRRSKRLTKKTRKVRFENR
jgi:hypothetical protein